MKKKAYNKNRKYRFEEKTFHSLFLVIRSWKLGTEGEILVNEIDDYIT